MSIEPSRPPTISPLRVLVIEDEPLVRLLLEDQLHDLGCVVAGEASRLPEALRLAETGQFDLGLIDVLLDGELAYPVAAVLQKRRIPFGFTSGVPHNQLDSAWAGVPFLDKPSPAGALAAFVASIVCTRRRF